MKASEILQLRLAAQWEIDYALPNITEFNIGDAILLKVNVTEGNNTYLENTLLINLGLGSWSSFGGGSAGVISWDVENNPEIPNGDKFFLVTTSEGTCSTNGVFYPQNEMLFLYSGQLLNLTETAHSKLTLGPYIMVPNPVPTQPSLDDMSEVDIYSTELLPSSGDSIQIELDLLQSDIVGYMVLGDFALTTGSVVGAVVINYGGYIQVSLMDRNGNTIFSDVINTSEAFVSFLYNPDTRQVSLSLNGTPYPAFYGIPVDIPVRYHVANFGEVPVYTNFSNFAYPVVGYSPWITLNSKFTGKLTYVDIAATELPDNPRIGDAIIAALAIDLTSDTLKPKESAVYVGENIWQKFSSLPVIPPIVMQSTVARNIIYPKLVLGDSASNSRYPYKLVGSDTNYWQRQNLLQPLYPNSYIDNDGNFVVVDYSPSSFTKNEMVEQPTIIVEDLGNYYPKNFEYRINSISSDDNYYGFVFRDFDSDLGDNFYPYLGNGQDIYSAVPTYYDAKYFLFSIYDNNFYYVEVVGGIHTVTLLATSPIDFVNGTIINFVLAYNFGAWGLSIYVDGLRVIDHHTINWTYFGATPEYELAKTILSSEYRVEVHSGRYPYKYSIDAVPNDNNIVAQTLGFAYGNYASRAVSRDFVTEKIENRFGEPTPFRRLTSSKTFYSYDPVVNVRYIMDVETTTILTIGFDSQVTAVDFVIINGNPLANLEIIIPAGVTNVTGKNIILPLGTAYISGYFRPSPQWDIAGNIIHIVGNVV